MTTGPGRTHCSSTLLLPWGNRLMCQCLQAKQPEQCWSDHKGMCHALRAYLQLTYDSFSDEISLQCCQDQMSCLHTRLLCFLANTRLLHVQHVLFYRFGTSYMQPMHLSGTGAASQGRTQSFSQQPALCSAENRLRKMDTGSIRQVFGLWPVRSPVGVRRCMSTEAQPQLLQFNMLCGRQYIFFQRLEEDSFLQYTCDCVSILVRLLVCKW